MRCHPYMFSHVGLWFTYMALPPTHHPIAIAMSATIECHDLIRYGVVKNTGAHYLSVVNDWLVWPHILVPYQAPFSPFICRERTNTPLHVML